MWQEYKNENKISWVGQAFVVVWCKMWSNPTECDLPSFLFITHSQQPHGINHLNYKTWVWDSLLNISCLGCSCEHFSPPKGGQQEEVLCVLQEFLWKHYVFNPNRKTATESLKNKDSLHHKQKNSKWIFERMNTTCTIYRNATESIEDKDNLHN